MPGRVFARSTVLLRLASSGEKAPHLVRWETEGGVLLSDDLSEVEWKAPALDGLYAVRVYEEATVPSAQTRQPLAELRVAVERPSTDDMVWIPPGAFLRGDVRGSKNYKEVKTLQNACDEPAYPVYLDGYWLDKHPVTHAKYARFLTEYVAQGLARVNDIAVMGLLDGAWVPLYYFQSFERLVPYYHDSRNARKPEFLHAISHDSSGFHVKPGREQTPVVDVSWFGAAAYARFHGKQLPSEAQWEKAARGKDSRRYPWGDSPPTSYHVQTDYYAPASPIPVGQFSPLGDSPYGVSDMLTNCFEWSNDWFNADYYADYQGAVPLRNPTGPFWGRAHAIRGLPYGVQFPQSSLEDVEPVSNRYSWFFEFEIGDTFANRSTTFRTVFTPPATVSP